MAVRIGIIGIGGMGSNHAEYLSRGEVEGAELTAVTDVSPERLQWAKESLPASVQGFNSPETLMESGAVDAVLIATPHYFHPPLAIQAFERGGVLANQCPHNLDLWQWICGMPVRVRAFCGFGKYHNIEVEDDVTAYVEYGNGATGVFVTSTGEAPGTNRLEISCDRGKVVMEGGSIRFWRTRESVSQFLREYPGGFGTPDIWECDIPGSGGGSHKGVTQNWVQAIQEGTPLLAPGVEGINGVQLSNAMLLSSWTDETVDIPVDEDLYYEKLQERIDNSTVQKDDSGARTMEVAGSFQ